MIFCSNFQPRQLTKSLQYLFALMMMGSCQTGFTNDNLADNMSPSTTLDTIVITATRTEKGVKETPIPVSVIGKKQLEENHARTLKQALELLPQLQLRPLHGKTGYEVTMQGFSGDQVLVLIDGLPVTASTGSKVNISQYLNVDVEQIEVIQGASSAQYGSSAMGGVVNVITKRLKPNDQRITGHITADVATNGEQNPSGKNFDDNYQFVEMSSDIQLDKQGDWLARVSASHLKDKGLRINPDAWKQLKDSTEQQQISAKLQYHPQQNQAFLQKAWLEMGHYQEDDESRFDTFKAPLTYNTLREEAIDKNRFSLGFNGQLKNINNVLQDTKLTGSVFYEGYDSHSTTSMNGVQQTNRTANMSTQIAQLQADFPSLAINDNSYQLWQVGFSHQKDDLQQQNNGNNELNRAKEQRDVSEVYLQNDWLIGDNWELIAGVRYQDDSDFGGHTAPKLAVKYNHIGDTGINHTWRASIGSGYRVPNLKERYYVFDHSALGYKVLGSSDLVPETSTSYQLGYQADILENLNLSVNLFYNDIKDLIQTDRTQPLRYEDNIAIYGYDNVDNATTYGGDVAIHWQALKNLELQFNYGYLHTHNATTGTELTQRPKHKADILANYQITPKLDWVNQVMHESKHLLDSEQVAYSPAWWVWNTKFNYQATPKLAVYTVINNVFDKQRDTSDSNDQSNLDNRQWLLGATYQF